MIGCVVKVKPDSNVRFPVSVQADLSCCAHPIAMTAQRAVLTGRVRTDRFSVGRSIRAEEASLSAPEEESAAAQEENDHEDDQERVGVHASGC